jgi:hypothetical protein
VSGVIDSNFGSLAWCSRGLAEGASAAAGAVCNAAPPDISNATPAARAAPVFFVRGLCHANANALAPGLRVLRTAVASAATRTMRVGAIVLKLAALPSNNSDIVVVVTFITLCVHSSTFNAVLLYCNPESRKQLWDAFQNFDALREQLQQ